MRSSGGMCGRVKESARWLTSFLALLAVLAATHVAAETLSLAAYRARLLQARALAVSELRQAARPPGGRATSQRLLAPLPIQAQVPIGSGVVTVDNRPLARSLAEALARPRPAARRAALQRLVVSLDQLLAATGAPAPPLESARADGVLRAVLRRPEYRIKPRGLSWVDRFVLWIARLLRRWFPNLGPRGAGDDGLARLMLVAVVLLLALLVARIILLVLPDLRHLRRREPEERPAGGLLVPREPAELLAEAEREAAAGRFREALRLIYLAMVTRLDRAGVLPEDRSRTHWELLRDLRRRSRDREVAAGSRLTAVGEGELVASNSRQPTADSRQPTANSLPSPLIDILTPMTRRLDERLYGGRLATADDYQAFRAAHDQIERLLCLPA